MNFPVRRPNSLWEATTPTLLSRDPRGTASTLQAKATRCSDLLQLMATLDILSSLFLFLAFTLSTKAATTVPPLIGGCSGTRFGCCADGQTPAAGPNFLGCPGTTPAPIVPGDCLFTTFGCCADGKTVATGPHFAGCSKLIGGCGGTRYGCCPDGSTAAGGENFAGCSQSSKALTFIFFFLARKFFLVRLHKWLFVRSVCQQLFFVVL